MENMFSYFSAGTITKSEPEPKENISLREYIERVKSGIFEQYTIFVKSKTYGSDEYKNAKKTLPYITPHATVSRKCNAGVLRRSGLFCFDIDRKDNPAIDFNKLKDQLQQNAHVIAIHFSPSGALSVFILVDIDPESWENHSLEYMIVFAEIQARYKVTLDRGQKAISQARYCCHDPEAYYNPNATPKEIIPPQKAEKDPEEPKEDKENERLFKSVLEYLKDSGKSITADYQNWIEVGLILANTFPDSKARTFFHEISSLDSNYDFNEADDKFSSLLKTSQNQNYSGDRKTLASLIGLARREGFVVPKDPEVSEEEEEEPGHKIIDFTYIPSIETPIIKINGVRVCSVGNILAVVAMSGSGKSHLCEGIAAGFINSFCDSLGTEVNLPEGKKILHLDGERTHNDCFNGLKRIARRVDVENNPGLIKGDAFENYIFCSMVGAGDIKKRKEILENLLKENDIGLLIIDDITLFVTDSNSISNSTEIRAWLVALANKYHFGVLATIHTNPGSENFKPRGHIGSELWRTCEAIYCLRKAEEAPQFRLLTTDFALTKTRNAKDINEVCFTWSDDEKMFVSADYIAPDTREPVIPYIQRFAELLPTGNTYAEGVRKADLIRRYKDAFVCSVATAKRHINEATEMEIIKKFQSSKSVSYTINDRYVD